MSSFEKLSSCLYFCLLGIAVYIYGRIDYSLFESQLSALASDVKLYI
jgi:hypothetical protein